MIRKIFVVLLILCSNLMFGCGTSLKNAEVGDTVHLGKYDDKPLSWVVLDTEGSKKFLMLSNAFGRHFYDDVNSENKGRANWINCSLRKFLNEQFYGKVLQNQEDVDVISVERRKDVYDKVFVLNEREVDKYLQKKKYIQARPTNFDSEYDAWENSNNGFTRYLLDNVNDEKIKYVDSNGDIIDGNRFLRYAIRPVILINIKG